MTPERRKELLTLAEQLGEQAKAEFEQAQSCKSNGDRFWLRRCALAALRAQQFILGMLNAGEEPLTDDEEEAAIAEVRRVLAAKRGGLKQLAGPRPRQGKKARRGTETEH
jgi:hypothetical protein